MNLLIIYLIGVIGFYAQQGVARDRGIITLSPIEAFCAAWFWPFLFACWVFDRMDNTQW
jgi:hypothetical protein